MRIGHLDAANDLADIEVRNSSSVVGVRVGTNNVRTASLGVVVLTQEIACDGIGVLGSIDGDRYMDVSGLKARVGKVRSESQGLSAGGCAGRGDMWRNWMRECMCSEAYQAKGNGD